jgi:hypothetical protein
MTGVHGEEKPRLRPSWQNQHLGPQSEKEPRGTAPTDHDDPVEEGTDTAVRMRSWSSLLVRTFVR